VEELLGLAAEEPRLRATLPFGLDVADAEQVEPELTEAVEALRDWLGTVDPAAVAARLRTRSWPATRPAPLRPLAQTAFVAALTPDDRIAARAGLAWQLTPDGDQRVTLHLVDRSVSFPAGCAPALRALLDGTVTRVGDLPGLDTDDDRLVLARRLLREAVAVPG